MFEHIEKIPGYIPYSREFQRFSDDGKIMFFLCREEEYVDSSSWDDTSSNSSQGGYQGQVWGEVAHLGSELWQHAMTFPDVRAKFTNQFNNPIKLVATNDLIELILSEKYRLGCAHPAHDEFFRRAELAGIKASQVKYDRESLQIIALYFQNETRC